MKISLDLGLKKYKAYVILGLIALALVGILYLRNCRPQRIQPTEPGTNPKTYQVQAQTYTPPIVKIPFITKDKQPVKSDVLPIPPAQVDKTIKIEAPGQAPTTIIIDKKGDVYLPKDAPADVKVSVVQWKPAFAALEFKFGTALVYSGAPHVCLSLDYFRVWRLYFGSEIGVSYKNNKVGYLIGLSGKLRLTDPSSRVDVRVIGGWDFLGNKPYVGLGVRF